MNKSLFQYQEKIITQHDVENKQLKENEKLRKENEHGKREVTNEKREMTNENEQFKKITQLKMLALKN